MSEKETLFGNLKKFCSSTWVKLEYEIGSYNQFRIEIAFFRGVDEGEGSYFVIDNLQVRSSCLVKKSYPFLSFVFFLGFPELGHERCGDLA